MLHALLGWNQPHSFFPPSRMTQDVACAECPLHGSEEALGGTPAALFCVLDGHCGRGAADAASTALPDKVSERLAGELLLHVRCLL